MNPKYTKNSNNKSPNVATKSGQIISTAYEMPNLGSYQRHAVLSQNQWARHPSQDNCYCLKINISARWTSIYCRWGCKHIQPWDRTAHIPQKNLRISRLYWISLSYSWMYIQKKWGQGAKERAAPHVFAAHPESRKEFNWGAGWSSTDKQNAICIQNIIQPQTEWNPVLSVAKRAELESIMLSEISQAQKNKPRMSFSIGGS